LPVTGTRKGPTKPARRHVNFPAETGASLLAGAVKVIGGLTTIAAFVLAIACFCILQDKIGKFPPAGGA
jgi:hypothetical protein